MPTLTGRFANAVTRFAPGLNRRFTRWQIDQYRSSGGRRGNTLAGKPVFLLDVVGRSSGKPRPVMLMLARRGDDVIVCGSYGGHPETPNWYRNLVAAGEAHVQVGAERWPVTARELPEGSERDECWTILTDAYPDFASYQQLTDRRLPVAVLERK